MKKLFEKRSVALAVMALGIAAGIVLGQARKPADMAPPSTTLSGTYQYVMDSEGVISDDTKAYIDAMNASLFAQTGAQIAFEIIGTTGNEDIALLSFSVPHAHTSHGLHQTRSTTWIQTSMAALVHSW